MLLMGMVHHELLPNKNKVFCISRSFHGKRCFISCTILIRWSASVIKEGVATKHLVKLLKEDRPIVLQ